MNTEHKCVRVLLLLGKNTFIIYKYSF